MLSKNGLSSVFGQSTILKITAIKKVKGSCNDSFGR